MLYRNLNRTVLKLNTAATATEITRITNSLAATTTSFALESTGFFYVGYAHKFCSRYFNLSTVSAGSATLTVTYWDGTTWSAVEDLQDETLGFTQDGFIGWQNPSDWNTTTVSPITDVQLYWIRIAVNSTLTSAVLQSVLNLFCDSVYLRQVYPELVSDSRYLAPSRSNLLEQLRLGTEKVVIKLSEKRALIHEGMILDINEVKLAAAHATAWHILFPIAETEEERQKVTLIHEAFVTELSERRFSFDLNESGTIDTQEVDLGLRYKPRGG